MRRSRMPVRSTIHSLEVSTIFSRSEFVNRCSGTYDPVPMSATGSLLKGFVKSFMSFYFVRTDHTPQRRRRHSSIRASHKQVCSQTYRGKRIRKCVCHLPFTIYGKLMFGNKRDQPTGEGSLFDDCIRMSLSRTAHELIKSKIANYKRVMLYLAPVTACWDRFVLGTDVESFWW